MTLLRKLVPAPLMSGALLVLWLALQREPSLGQLVLGLALALAIPRLTWSIRPTRVQVRRPLVALRFIATVAYDVIASNLNVAWGVIRWRFRPARSKFVIIPLDLRDPLGLTALAMVTTVVPGTVWSELALDRSSLLLHVWDVEDEEAFIAHYKTRYEKPLREIFE